MNRKQRKQGARERHATGGDGPRKQHGDSLKSEIPRDSAVRSDEAIRSSRRAQKSEVHETTDDASTSPASGARTPKGTPDAARRRTGAGDASSGGGAGAGIPGGGTDLRMGERIQQRDPDEDTARLFPDSQSDRDESDFGGPARVETDEQGNLKD